MARKKEERVSRPSPKKEEKKVEKDSAEEENIDSFTVQLSKLGLELRDIPGDGNCLFRALGDQVDGHGRSHLSHRRDVVQYMSDHRADFEPFVEDDVPFDRHVIGLSSPGTYAGNDAIVAFARLHQLTVVIHQFNSPLWEIHGSSKPSSKQIHISYHNGDHYSSVRRIGDFSECPNSIRFMNGKLVGAAGSDKKSAKLVTSSTHCQNGWGITPGVGHDGTTNSGVGSEEGVRDSRVNDNVKDASIRSCIKNMALVTGCRDRKLISEIWREHGCDFESTVSALKTVMAGSSNVLSDMVSDQQTTSSDSDTSTPSSASDCGDVITISSGRGNLDSGAKSKARQASNSHRRRERKLEKKAKAEERHRMKILGGATGGNLVPRGATSSEEDDNLTSIHLDVTDHLKVLQI